MSDAAFTNSITGRKSRDGGLQEIPEGPGGEKRPLIAEDRARARVIIELARKKGRQILKKAQEDAEKIRKEAHEIGHKEGLEQGRQKGLADGRKEWDIKAQELWRKGEEMLHDMEESALEMATAIAPKIRTLIVQVAEKILKKKIEEDDELILRTILEASQSLVQKDVVQLMVRQDEMDKVLERKNEIISACDMIKDFDISAREMERGGCIIDSSSGTVDARIESQLEVLSEIVHNQ